MNQRNINARVGSSIGGKSSRSGELLAQKLLVEGIQNQQVLQAIARSPRHIMQKIFSQTILTRRELKVQNEPLLFVVL